MNVSSDSIYQHFRKEEIPLIDELRDRVNQAIREYRPIITDFLDPRQQFIARSLVSQGSGVKVEFNGGIGGAERKRALFYPDYYTPSKEDFGLSLFEIVYPRKFSQLHHGQVLGTLANSGLDRSVLGDILTDGNHWQVVVEQQIADYIQLQIEKIGRIKVKLEPISFDQAVENLDEYETQTTTLSSLRIDNLISDAFNFSRKVAKDLIREKRIHVNWTLVDKPDWKIGVHDIVSVRKYGRIKVLDLLGETRKDKLRVKIGVLNKNR